MWTRVFNFCDINFENNPQLISEGEIIFKNDHPFAVLNNDLVSLGTILESIFTNSSVETRSKLIELYSIKVSKLSFSIKKNITNYQIDEKILDSILSKLLKPIQDISNFEFLDQHKSLYYQTMQNICKYKKVNKIFIYDEKLFDDYLIRTNYDINVGVAVAVEDGLLVPVVRNADVKNLEAISNEIKNFASRAKNKELQPSDWEGNTFTISNLGMFGIDQFTAIVNPPDSCILAVGGIQSIPVVKNGEVVPGNIMKLTLSCDHRVVDGAKGSAFLNTVKNFLEAPVKMML